MSDAALRAAAARGALLSDGCLGVTADCECEARGALLVVRTVGLPGTLRDAAARARAHAVARAHGFTHLALELAEPEAPARPSDADDAAEAAAWRC